MTISRQRLFSPKARKLIKHTSLIMHGEYKNTSYNTCKNMSLLSVSENNIRSVNVSQKRREIEKICHKVFSLLL